MSLLSLIKTHNFNISNILLHVILIASFITIMFFTYGVNVEKNVFREQIDIFIKENVNGIKYLFPDLAEKLKNIVKDLKFQNLDEKDKIVADSNKKILMNVITILIICVIIIVIIIGVIYKFITPDAQKDGYLKKLLINNISALIVVAIVYILFITFYIGTYQSVDNNVIRKNAIDAIINVVNNKTIDIDTLPLSITDILKKISSVKSDNILDIVNTPISQPITKQLFNNQPTLNQPTLNQPTLNQPTLNQPTQPTVNRFLMNKASDIFQQNDPNLL
jgi:hypothetical protein